MVASCVLFALMGSLVYQIQLYEPEASVLVTSFVRIVVNLVILIGIGLASTGLGDLLGDRRGSLWARGVFGSLALTCSFASIRAIGLGESSFLHASNGVFVALFAPLALKQRNGKRVWLAIAGALVGLFLLFEPRLTDGLPYGRLLALAAGFFSALAYVMIARAGRSNSPNTVIFYFCVTALAFHLLLFLAFGVVWPVKALTWVMLLGAGVFGSFAQVYLTKAYQNAPAALASAVSYLGPVLNLLAGIVFFARVPDGRAFAGAAIVLVFGVILPFVKLPATRAVAVGRALPSSD